MDILITTLIALFALGIIYAVLGVALRIRQKRHGGSLTCSSVRMGGESISACTCRAQGKEPGSCHVD